MPMETSTNISKVNLLKDVMYDLILHFKTILQFKPRTPFWLFCYYNEINKNVYQFPLEATATGKFLLQREEP